MKTRLSNKTGRMRRTPYLYRWGYQEAVMDPVKVKRRRGTWFKRIGLLAVGAAGIFFIGMGVRGVVRSDLFKVRHIEITGLERLSAQELEPIVSGDGLEKIFEVDLVSLQERLMGHPWIKEVQIRKAYPDTLTLTVSERQPAAVVEEDSRKILVDETGRALKVIDSSPKIDGRSPSGPEPDEDRPVIAGVDLDALRSGDPGQQSAFRNAMAILSVVERADRIQIRPGQEILVERDGYRIRFGEGNWKEKWDQFVSVQPDMAHRMKKVQEVDLRFSGQVIVR